MPGCTHKPSTSGEDVVRNPRSQAADACSESHHLKSRLAGREPETCGSCKAEAKRWVYHCTRCSHTLCEECGGAQIVARMRRNKARFQFSFEDEQFTGCCFFRSSCKVKIDDSTIAENDGDVCKGTHSLSRGSAETDYECDLCDADIEARSGFYTCAQCDFSLCDDCVSMAESNIR